MITPSISIHLSISFVRFCFWLLLFFLYDVLYCVLWHFGTRKKSTMTMMSLLMLKWNPWSYKCLLLKRKSWNVPNYIYFSPFCYLAFQVNWIFNAILFPTLSHCIRFCLFISTYAFYLQLHTHTHTHVCMYVYIDIHIYVSFTDSFTGRNQSVYKK